MSTQTDKTVLDLLNKVKAKKQEIEGIKRPDWKTSCSLTFAESAGARVNIQTCSDINVLLDLTARLIEREKNLGEAACILGIFPPVKYNGYSFSDWKTDLKTRASQLNVKAKQEELNKLEERVNKLVSPEQRREIELEELTKLIG